MPQPECTKDWCWNDELSYKLRCQDKHDMLRHGGRFEFFSYGRCKSGNRWFWAVDNWRGYDQDGPLDRWQWYGWEDTEAEAKAAAEQAVRAAADGKPVYVGGTAGHASRRLREINKAKRAARPPADTSSSAPIEFLYSCWGDPVRITKKTRKRIFYVKEELAAHCRQENQVVCNHFLESPADLPIGFVDRCLVFDEWPATDHDLYSFRAVDSRGKKRSRLSCFWLKPHPDWVHGKPQQVDLKQLKAAMAAAHPDKGGSNAAFIAARQIYQEAKAAARH